jgi:flagellar basal body rod protein FlgG
MIELAKDTAFSHRVLDAISARTKMAMHNLANKNTPGYKRYVVQFEDRLRAALKDGGDFGGVRPVIERDTSGSPEANNVSEFDEVAVIEKARALHDIFTKRIGGYFGTLNRSIRGS